MDHRSLWALDRAKENIERSYPVVGVLEKLSETVKAIEDKYPKIFAGIYDFFRNLDEKGKKGTEIRYLSNRAARLVEIRAVRYLDKDITLHIYSTSISYRSTQEFWKSQV